MKKLFILFFLSVVMIMAACSDDDTFTTSRSNLLSFSTDTLRLDTTFSNVPTSTKIFWVYNKSGDGLRLTNVRLAQGNQTGFRVNVDGVELSAGYVALNRVEARSDHIHACWITDEEDSVGKLLGTQMKVEDRAVTIDDELRGGDGTLITHKYSW